MKENNGKVKPFGMKDRLGYMFGDFGNDFTFILSTMFLLKFYTDVMGVSAAIVGLMMMAARFVDAVTDVTMGQIVDRSRPGKKGKFAPWIRRMCGPVALACMQHILKECQWALRFSGCFSHICSGAVYVIQALIFLMVQWHQQFRIIQRTELLFPTGEQLVQHLHRQ